MDRLQSELERLYLPPAGRAVVLEVARPAGWQEVARVWQGVQEDLDLPAPAIAISGSDAYQLWFAFEPAVPENEAQAFVDGLRKRYLGGVPAERLRIQPPGTLPPAQLAPEQWSAFVAADLAPLFADEPWLDHPPGRDAQADLLSRVVRIGEREFRRVLGEFTERAEPAAAPAASGSVPRAVLLSVMRDSSVDLHLRIEAAKALLAAERS